MTFSARDLIAVLSIRDYRYFILSRFWVTLGIQMQTLVVSWQVYDITRDPLMLGLIGLTEAAVFIALALWAGHAADRIDKRRMILASQVLLLIGAVCFALFAGPGMTRVGWMYGVIAVTGAARSLLWPASFSYSELTVPRAIYARAATLNSTAWEVAAILGPAAGGMLYAWKGPQGTYGLVVLLLAAALGMTVSMGSKPPVPEGPEGPRDLFSGIRFVFSRPVILGAMSLDMFAVLFGGVYAILPLFADRLGVGAWGLGWLRAAPSLGAIVTAFFLAVRPPLANTGRTLLMAVACFGLFTIAFAFSDHFGWSMALLAASGMADNFSVVIRASIFQAFSPDGMRGRVSSVNGIFIGSSNEIGAFESGLAARLLGTVPSVVFGGVMTLVTVAWVAWAFPDLRRLRRLAAEV